MKLEEGLITFYRRMRPRKYGWFGNYNNWQHALSQTAGYNSNQILEKVKSATLKVKNGEAVYERDSVLFDHMEYSWPLVSTLLKIGMQNNKQIKVIDFGGSLGSSYFQNRQFLKEFDLVEWNIVEQENYVECGQQFIQDHELKFYKTVDDCIASHGLPHLLLLSCTLPYIEKPYELLEYLIAKAIPYFMIDNTIFNNNGKDRLMIQKVNPAIYAASYPCWILDYEKVQNTVKKRYNISFEHTNDNKIELDGKFVNYKGFLGELK
jgi:putative methyltransferase (TIGR04325 family)